MTGQAAQALNRSGKTITETIALVGIDCTDCAEKVKKGVTHLPGVTGVAIDPTSTKMAVEYDPEEITGEQIVKIVESLGYGVLDTPTTLEAHKTVLRLSGLDCGDCAARLERQVGLLPGVNNVRVNFGASKMTVEHTASIEKIIQAIDHAGYGAEVESIPGIFKTTHLRLDGLDCADCAAKLEKKVAGLEGVKSVQVNFGASKMTVEHAIALEKILKAIDEVGYQARLEGAEGRARKSVFRLSGLDCADCAVKLEKKVRGVAGVSAVSVNFGASKMTVEHTAPIESILKAVDEAGYGAELEGAGKRPEEVSFWKRNRRALLTVVSGVALGAGFVLSLLGIEEKFLFPFYLLAMVSGGFYVGRSAYYALRSFNLDMNFLMSVAAIGAAFIGEWVEGATVVFLFSLGNTLQALTMDKTRRSIQALMDLSPKEALVKRNGKEFRLPVEEIQVGDVIIVKPGERIAMDGVVLQGSSGVNQAPITGESMPVEKKPGDEVYAGTINERGALEVEVTKLVEDTTLAKIINLVEEAQAQKAPSQQFVDVFARYYTPAVIVAAVGIAVIPPLFLGLSFSEWFYKALVLLVIACPCALVISTPVSIVSAIGNAARNGVLIKGGAYLEEAGALNVIAFDKTGTLTTGQPAVTDLVVVKEMPGKEILGLAAAIETRSQHPLGEAIVRHAREQGLAIPEAADFESITGKGAKATIDGKPYYIGNPRLFDELGLEVMPVWPRLERLQGDGKTAMLVGTDKEIIGIIAVADRVRENSKPALAGLKKAGIRKLVMLTGDNEGTARAIARELGIDEFKAELLPENKLETIKGLTREYGKVAMVGDGVNDAPALAAANVGIAMGVAGTDTALETADIALMADDLTKLPYAMQLSRKALAVIKQNIFFSLVVKGAFIVLTFMGFSTLWMAVFADTGAALLVIANGMRLLRIRAQLAG